MKIVQLFMAATLMLFLFMSCNKKTSPGSSRSVYGSDKSAGSTSTSTSKTVTVKKTKTVIPKVIVVNDSVAKKTFDGRLYYDLNGHRYWRSNKDGKYYLYNKSMNTNPDFKKPI
jgi:hypothetical protein